MNKAVSSTGCYTPIRYSLIASCIRQVTMFDALQEARIYIERLDSTPASKGECSNE